MKKFAAICSLFMMSLPAVAVDNGRVMYVGGTVPGIKARTIGRLDTTNRYGLGLRILG
jgi:hypothetical protein